MSPDTGARVEHLRETLVERRPVFAGRLLHVFDDEVALPGGGRSRREVVAHRGAVAVVAVAADGRVALVRQWRHAVAGALWEIPAGTREEGEDPAATAVRELREETGYSAVRWRHLGVAPVSPGYSSELLDFFLAEDLRAGDSDTDHDETIDVRLFDPADVEGLLHAGLTDCKTLAGLAMAGRLPALAGTAGGTAR